MDIKEIPIQVIYTLLAMSGGAARYLHSFITGTRFKFSVFVASMFVAGFSGYMFALFGISLQLPMPMPSILAGLGGFFGDQSMKFIYEFITKKELGGGIRDTK